MIQIPPELEGEYIIRVMDMPECLNGMVKYDEDDYANVYVNAKLNAEARQKAADHELTHVINDDIHNFDPIEVIEARADDHTTTRKTMPVLKKASELLPLTPVDKRQHAKLLSPNQSAVLIRAISELDRFLFSDAPYFD